jgi:hypothetical protein
VRFPDEDGHAPHPPASELDAMAAGDEESSSSFAEHVAACEGCSRYVNELRASASAFRAKGGATAFVARARAGGERRVRAARRSQTAWIVTPVVAAAAVALLVRGRPQVTTQQPAVESKPLVVSPEVHFKGGLSVVVVREREGAQERLVGPFRVRAGDRIRVEISTDKQEALTAGLLSDRGLWTPLLAPATLAPGTHYSELAARFDAAPTAATLLVGSPDALERARQTHDFTGLLGWPVRSEP